MKQDKVISSVKDTELIKKRRKQMIKGAISLFKKKGFHRTTTREIAKESGFSIGTLYEYIRTKEDILYLVCDAIHEQVHNRLEAKINLKEPSIKKLESIVESYFHLMNEMQEEIVIVYQEVKSLNNDARKYVLQQEVDMVNMLKQVILTCVPYPMLEQNAELLANNIFVQGHMWGFRRWALQRQFRLEEYIDMQIYYLMQSLEINKEVSKT